MPMTNRKRRAGGRKRTLVLDAVIDVLAQRGYESTRFADVSAASGVAISTLQNYFGSREDMVIEAMGLSLDREVAALEAVATAEPDPWRRLVAMVDRGLDHPDQTRRMLVEFWRSAMRDDELREYSGEVERRYREPFLAAIREGGERGEFTLTHEPEDVADLLLSILSGATLARALNPPAPGAAGFRGVLLTQLRLALGLPPRQHEIDQRAARPADPRIERA